VILKSSIFRLQCLAQRTFSAASRSALRRHRRLPISPGNGDLIRGY
jgi:hypothetical protein